MKKHNPTCVSQTQEKQKISKLTYSRFKSPEYSLTHICKLNTIFKMATQTHLSYLIIITLQLDCETQIEITKVI